MAKEMPVGKAKAKFEKPVAAKVGPAPTHKPKTFSISKAQNDEAGKKILIYGRTGMGKSSLAALAPSPVFIDPDGSLFDLEHPNGGEFSIIPQIESFLDLRDALHSYDLFDGYETVALDTITKVQNGWCTDHVVEHIKKEKGGKAKSITDYGWAKGYEHIYNQLQLLEADLDNLVRRGKNAILLAQWAQTVKTDSTHGEYWFDHADLYDKKNSRVLGLFTTWANYVFKIDWASVEIEGKVGVASDQRAIFTKPEFSYDAKARGSKFKDYPAVTFDEPNDDSLWRIMFDG